MTSYTDVFGADTIPPSDESYVLHNIAASATLAWPSGFNEATGELLVADITEISASTTSLTLTLPAADNASVGEDILFRNVGANSVEILDNASGSVATVAAGESKYFYITDNSTAAGTWATFTYGTGTSAADASALAGNGLKALAGKLAQDHSHFERSSNYTVATTDRAKFISFINSATVTLPLVATVTTGFFFALRNNSAGVLTVNTTGGELVNETSSLSLQPEESAFFFAADDDWLTVGLGKDIDFAFSEIVLDAATTSHTLSASDVSGRMIRLSGTASASGTVTLPSIDNIYFVTTESGLGSFGFTFTTGSGTTVDLNADQSTALYCDGTNVTTAINTTVTSTLSLTDGSAAAPSFFYALETNTGFFRRGSGQLAATSLGTEVGYFDSSGWNGSLTGGTVSGLSSAIPVADGGTGVTTLAALKSALSLNNVDNTSDLNKPISTATQAALDLKVALADNNTFTGIQTFGAALREDYNAIAASDIDLSLGGYYSKTISGSTTFTVSNVAASGTVSSFILELTNGGSATVTWFAGVEWTGGVAPNLTASGLDVLGFFTRDGGTTWTGMLLAKDVS